MSWSGTLVITELLDLYRASQLHPRDVIEHVYARIESRGDDNVWIYMVPKAEAMERARDLERSAREAPLFGIPFAVKDLFDVSGLPTTAACPAYSYIATGTATLVRRLLEAGAILIGKTNLDQFATGLVGVRTPYGIARNPFDSRYIPGGSSSGSAVAVATGLVSFALGSDTAGSGRVPAAFANIVGMKPSRGLLSSGGMVPACRTLDCPSIFALTCADVRVVMHTVAGFDPDDSWSRPEARTSNLDVDAPAAFRFGVPGEENLCFFGDCETPALFANAIQDLEQIGGIAEEVDYTSFRQAGELLYQGPWIAERLAHLNGFLAHNAEATHPVTRGIIQDAVHYSAADTFLALYHLADLKRRTESIWEKIDTLIVPTAGTTYTIEDVQVDPVGSNTNLGYYTNFVNLLDCCAVAIPCGFTSRGLPFGITLVAPAWRDGLTLALAERLQRLLGLRLGATESLAPIGRPRTGFVYTVVAGAHLRGQPLNMELRALGGRFVRQSRTAPCYRLFALGGTSIPKPGLVKVIEGGTDIEVEVWELSLEAFGHLVSLTPPPLAMGSVTLKCGQTLNGFVCEPFALDEAKDITSFGSWRAFQQDSAR